MQRVKDRVNWVFPAPEQGEIAYKSESGKVVVYPRRFHILIAYALSYFLWNMHTFRQTILTQEYAKYFDTTNEFNPSEGELGVDFMLLADSFYLVLMYPLAGYLVDRYGMVCIAYGSVGQAISTWWWYLSFDNFGSVLASRVLASMSGVMIACGLLPLTMTWFPTTERALAVAAGTIVATFGAGAALVLGPLFYTGEQAVDVSLKSCEKDFRDNFNASAGSECTEEAELDFCCVYPADIDTYNLILALACTLVAVYTVVVMQQRPPTPPSVVGKTKENPTFKQAVVLMFSHRNYAQICLADFIASGPPLVLFSSISRIFPPSVSDYSFLVAATGLVLAIPVVAYFSQRLAKKQNFYGLTAATYTGGFLFWTAAALCYAVATDASEVAILGLGAGALVSLSLWTVSVYELKMEYVYDRTYSLGGFIVGFDRTIINLSTLVFVAAIPPERFESLDVPGRNMTMYIGSVFMLFGVILVWTIKDKYLYLRTAHEDEEKEGKIDTVSNADGKTIEL
mmetsp:Transcript_3004/g.3570  ORF Transcript_3004/g.3570 Transcript_3004/m.3570 type:complete len:511 (-) Transcript_3004:1545-3077(-)